MEYYEELQLWIRKLKRADRFHLSNYDILSLVDEHGATFNNYDKLELLATFYMLERMFLSITDSDTIAKLTIDFLEDDSTKCTGSQKLLIYYYQIYCGEI